MPTIISGREQAERLVDDLEVRFLANRDPNLLFALATDFRDASEEKLPSDEDLLRYAGELGLDQDAFKKCVAEGRFAAQVDRDLQAGREAGVTGTPAFFINGVLVSGSKPADDFFELIDGELARAAAQAKPEGA